MTIRKARPQTSAPGTSRRAGRETVRNKKTLLLDQRLLDRARQALGARTETETVTQALEAVLQREQQIHGLRTLAALGPIDATRID
jgi:hypothetical protein